MYGPDASAGELDLAGRVERVDRSRHAGPSGWRCRWTGSAPGRATRGRAAAPPPPPRAPSLGLQRSLTVPCAETFTPSPSTRKSRTARRERSKARSASREPWSRSVCRPPASRSVGPSSTVTRLRRAPVASDRRSVGIHSDLDRTSIRPTVISSPPGSVRLAVPSSTWSRRRWNCRRSGGGHGAGFSPGRDGGRTRFTLGRTTETSSRAMVFERACSGRELDRDRVGREDRLSRGPDPHLVRSTVSRSGRTRQVPKATSRPGRLAGLLRGQVAQLPSGPRRRGEPERATDGERAGRPGTRGRCAASRAHSRLPGPCANSALPGSRLLPDGRRPARRRLLARSPGADAVPRRPRRSRPRRATARR